MAAGTVLVYAALGATGFFLYGNLAPALALTLLAAAAAVLLAKVWPRLERR